MLTVHCELLMSSTDSKPNCCPVVSTTPIIWNLKTSQTHNSFCIQCGVRKI
ncbi:hypothetical protein BDL97_14G051400 [Sphagnum fallax]|nr:hypothetical protein BDL97_14G051400 [Sphagnum fallax]